MSRKSTSNILDTILDRTPAQRIAAKHHKDMANLHRYNADFHVNKAKEHYRRSKIAADKGDIPAAREHLRLGDKSKARIDFHFEQRRKHTDLMNKYHNGRLTPSEIQLNNENNEVDSNRD